MSLLDLSKFERKFEPKMGVVLPGALLPDGLPKLLGGVVAPPGTVLRIAGGLKGIVVPRSMNGALSAGTPMTPVPGGGTVVRGVRMLLKPRAGVLGVTGTKVPGATVPGAVL